jgi:hypothetical protein
VRRFVSWFAILSWISLAEWKVFERLLFVRSVDVDFVLVNLRGILAGTPVSKSWQQRFVGPLLVSALAAVAGEPLVALKLFSALMVLAANLLLFALMRRRGASVAEAMLAVVCFGFAHFVSIYRLEYPWDGIDVLVFLAFGYWAARGHELLPLVPLLLLGAFNHETVLYIPLWYLLAPLDGERLSAGLAKRLATALATMAVVAAVIALARNHFYVGRPDLPGQEFEQVTPIVENHLHVRHNLSNLFFGNWVAGRAHISLALLSTLAVLTVLAHRVATRRAAVWTLCGIASIVCFGYVNETRHYLSLLSFWFAYAWPVPFSAAQVAVHEAGWGHPFNRRQQKLTRRQRAVDSTNSA